MLAAEDCIPRRAMQRGCRAGNRRPRYRPQEIIMTTPVIITVAITGALPRKEDNRRSR